MVDPNSDIDELLEAFFDGDLDPAEHQRVERLIEESPEVAERVALRERVDASLRRFGSAPAADTSFLSSYLDGSRSAAALGAAAASGAGSLESVANGHGAQINDRDERNDLAEPLERRDRGYRKKMAYAAIAATAAWLLVGSQFFVGSDAHQEVAFVEKPLSTVYSQCVNEGFEPYWLCEDDDLFAATFERRQGVPLQLADMPAGRRMVGLSYLAGISRKSTSMLAMVDDTPVIVFIDRRDRDWAPKTGQDPESGLFVKRVEKHGLVFYEVSPFPDVYVAEYFFVRPKT